MYMILLRLIFIPDVFRIPSLNLGKLEDRERRVPISHLNGRVDDDYKLNPPSPTSTVRSVQNL